MDFKQKTIEEMIESERLMVFTAPQRYGAYWTLASNLWVFLSALAKSKSYVVPREIFVRFLSQVEKHHLLAAFSTVRLHHIQAMMNLRQVLEAGVCAAFAIANPDLAHFADFTAEGTLDASKTLANKRYEWLRRHFPEESSYIKAMKDQINNSTAHANIVYTQRNYREADGGEEFSTPFFDIEDEDFVTLDLLLASRIALKLIDLFYSVNKDVKAIVWRDDFESQLVRFAKQEKALSNEMTSSDLFKERQQTFES